MFYHIDTDKKSKTSLNIPSMCTSYISVFEGGANIRLGQLVILYDEGLAKQTAASLYKKHVYPIFLNLRTLFFPKEKNIINIITKTLNSPLKNTIIEHL